jgi:hypothetical protein
MQQNELKRCSTSITQLKKQRGSSSTNTAAAQTLSSTQKPAQAQQ